MFKFLKEKLKNAVSFFSKKVEDLPESVEETKIKLAEQIPEKPVAKPSKEKETKKKEIKLEKDSIVWEEKHKIAEEIVTETKPEEEKGFFTKLKDKFTKTEEVKEQPEIKEEKKGFFGYIAEKVTTKRISEEKFDELFWDLELAMLENNVAVEVIEKIKKDLKEKLVNVPIRRNEVEVSIVNSLKTSIRNLFNVEGINLLEKIKNKKDKPYVILFFGINGSGKTSSVAKLAYMLQKKNISVVMVAADTWRAASIEQLEEHGNKLGIKVIKHDYGADPAAVAFDGIKHAQARNLDVVLIDTAGRMHSNTNLIQEMEKINRVTKPDLKIFVGESITGNDCVIQSETFDKSVGIDAIILTKSDIDEKGGAIISISYVTKKPILFLGTGQDYNDLKEFNPDEVVASIGL